MGETDQNKKGLRKEAASLDRTFHPRVDSQALQEIIAVLQHPFQTSCDTCNGLGFIRSGQDCPTCEGSGKVIDKVFK